MTRTFTAYTADGVASEHWSIPETVEAQCIDCVLPNASRSNHTPAGARALARRHVARTGHTVEVVIARVYTYSRDPGRKA